LGGAVAVLFCGYAVKNGQEAAFLVSALAGGWR
jgi:hypothetical protein